MRMILQGLILAGVLWLAASISTQNSSIVKLQTQMETLQASLAGIPDLNTRVTKLETELTDQDRRVTTLESFRRDQAAPAEQRLKGFVR